MMRCAVLTLCLFLAGPALAQQNQTPGDTDAGGNSRVETGGAGRVQAALSGANTSDATTTGASGPSAKKGGSPGKITLPPLPSGTLCETYAGEVRIACLSTTLNEGSSTSGAAQ